ncbi:MAG: ABC-type dipeptide transport system, periplasmic component [Verrucomicrobiota bacterium]|jgi:peptide/nickel transport system substrate-binding protein
MKTHSLCLAVAAVATLLFTGCKKEEGSAPGNKPGSSAPAVVQGPLPVPPLVAGCAPGVRGGRLVISTFGDPKTFNPIASNEGSSEDIYRLIFASLLTLDMPSQKMLPGLAHQWSVAADQKTWTFKLRSGLLWSDGKPLTADDVVFTFKVIYDPDVPNPAIDLLKVDGKPFQFTKVDNLTVQFVTPEPCAPFEENVGSIPILPQHILAKALAEKKFVSAYGVDTSPSGLVGSGPFKLKQYKAGEFTLLERNPNFFIVDKAGTRLPYLDHLMYQVVPDMNAMSLRFLKGENDLHEFLRPDEVERFKTEAAKSGRFQVMELGIGLERGFFWLNQNTNLHAKTGKPIVDPKKLAWFRNQKFRQALAHAVDRPSIVKSVYAGKAQANFGYITAANKKWLAEGLAEYPFDPARARALLKEIGIEDRNGNGILEDAQGTEIEFTFNTNTGNSNRDRIAVIVQADLKKLGIKVNYQPIEFNTLITRINDTYEYECVLLSLGGGSTDPSSSMNVLKSDGYTHEWFPKQKTPSTDWEARMDKLMDEQHKTLDFAKRKALFDEVQVIMSTQVPLIYTVSPISYVAVRNELANLRPSPLSYYRISWNAEELYFKKQ